MSKGLNKLYKKHKKRREVEWTPFEAASGANPVKDTPCFVNSLYQVSIDAFESGWLHLSIIRRDRSAVHDWRHLQRIKNELCGPECEAFELYPAESRLVDTNNQFHLWVLPPGDSIPVGYKDRDVATNTFGVHKQRPFEDPPPDLNAVQKDPTAEVDIMIPPRVVEDARGDGPPPAGEEDQER